MISSNKYTILPCKYPIKIKIKNTFYLHFLECLQKKSLKMQPIKKSLQQYTVCLEQ